MLNAMKTMPQFFLKPELMQSARTRKHSLLKECFIL